MKETDGIYHFNRCRRCNGLITKLEVLRAFKTGKDVCACGSAMFGPTNPVGAEWLKPKSLKMIVYQLLGLLAPAPPSDVMPPLPGGVNFKRVGPLSPDEIRAPEEGEK
jgi:hypothetical protein